MKDAFMARLRIPGGVVTTFQLRELARIAQELTSGYVQITTRANFQMRLIQPKDAPEFLRRIQGVGLHTRGAGADNIRNLTMNPTAGIDPVELINVHAVRASRLAQIIINDRSFYDLPRKFNIAYDGGGLIGTVEDTNDIGVKAVKVRAKKFCSASRSAARPATRRLRTTSASSFRRLKSTRSSSPLCAFTSNSGCRTDRKKARLKHLLENDVRSMNTSRSSKKSSAHRCVARLMIRRRCAGPATNCRIRTSAIFRRNSAA